MKTRLITSIFSLILAFSLSHAQELDPETLKTLNDDSFKVREEATKKLITSDVSIQALQQALTQTEEPEIKLRLNLAIQGKIEATGWVVLTKEEIVKRATPCGHELKVKTLYLARTNHDGSDYIGKYMTDWEGANFPVGENELHLPDFQIWIGKGTWKKWTPDSKNLIPMGTTKEGKTIFAVRAEWENGSHPGTLIQGETKARIPWGGKVILLDNFEALQIE